MPRPGARIAITLATFGSLRFWTSSHELAIIKVRPTAWSATRARTWRTGRRLKCHGSELLYRLLSVALLRYRRAGWLKRPVYVFVIMAFACHGISESLGFLGIAGYRDNGQSRSFIGHEFRVVVMTAAALLLTPLRGCGGGIERYVETVAWVLDAQGVSCSRMDLAGAGIGAHARACCASAVDVLARATDSRAALSWPIAPFFRPPRS